MTLTWHKVVKTTRSRYSLTSHVECRAQEGAGRVSLETTSEQLERCGRPHLLRHAVPNSWCGSRKGTVAPIVEVGCDGQQVQGRRRTQNEVTAVSRLTLETPSRSVEQTSVVELRQDKRHHEWLEHVRATSLTVTVERCKSEEDGDTSSCRSQDVCPRRRRYQDQDTKT